MAMRFLIAALLLMSCVTAPRTGPTVRFVDGSAEKRTVWVCLYAEKDLEHRELLCGELEEFLKLVKPLKGDPASL
jgi:hypothetical protein